MTGRIMMTTLIPMVLCAGLLLAGCSTLPRTTVETEPPLRKYEDLVDNGRIHPLEIYDPLEGLTGEPTGSTITLTNISFCRW